MDNIFWYQPEKLSDDDVVILNGKLLSKGSERIKAFGKLKIIADKAIEKKRPWYGFIDKYYFVKGSLDKKDERGRQLSFMFISDAQNGKKELQETLKIIGIGLNPETESLFNNKIRKNNYLKPLIWIALLLGFALLTILISNKYGK